MWGKNKTIAWNTKGLSEIGTSSRNRGMRSQIHVGELQENSVEHKGMRSKASWVWDGVKRPPRRNKGFKSERRCFEIRTPHRKQGLRSERWRGVGKRASRRNKTRVWWFQKCKTGSDFNIASVKDSKQTKRRDRG